MKEKLLKVKILSKRGSTEGERESAKHLLKKLCKKYGIKPEALKEITDIKMSYSDGVTVIFRDGKKTFDYQFPNGEVVRYFADGRRQVLREAVQFSFTDTSSIATGGF